MVMVSEYRVRWYRYQVTPWGNSLIPLPEELQFVASGIYSGKSALMVMFWTAGTIVLSLTTLFSIGYWNRLPQEYLPVYPGRNLPVLEFYTWLPVSPNTGPCFMGRQEYPYH